MRLFADNRAAHRTLIVRKLKGLEDIIPFTSVHWSMQEKGWQFVKAEDNVPGEGVEPDPVPGHEKYTHLRVRSLDHFMFLENNVSIGYLLRRRPRIQRAIHSTNAL
jgi:glutathionyl-hydroquinone reductase